VYHSDADLAHHLLDRPGDAPTTRAAQRRLDGAHARYLSAVKALATVQKLLKSAPSALDLLAAPVPEARGVGATGRRRPAPHSAPGVPVAN
jgi:hypothetical protein